MPAPMLRMNEWGAETKAGDKSTVKVRVWDGSTAMHIHTWCGNCAQWRRRQKFLKASVRGGDIAEFWHFLTTVTHLISLANKSRKAGLLQVVDKRYF